MPPVSVSGLRIAEVSHTFGDFVAARGVGLEVPPGEVHCLLGPSGSGKSTLLRLVAGLELLQEGRIEIGGAVVAGPRIHVRPEERAVGFVFQDYALFPHLDVRRNVTFGMDGTGRKDHKAAADTLLRRVGMTDYADAMPHTLSGGQQQRVALARALARRPAVMLLDEPFSGLDARLRADVRRATLDVLRAAGVATLMVTHDPAEAMLAGDAVSVIRAGRVLQTGSPDELYYRSASGEVAEVFGPVNRLSARVEGGQVPTPFGPLPADGYGEGDRVDVLFRPESVELFREPEAGAVGARVEATVSEGALVHLTVHLDDGSTVDVRDLARRPWAPGDRVWARLGEDVATLRPGREGPGET
ncbi:MAG: ABC transporter ATP-binding protein [Acidobacteriota bacterium]